VVGVTIRSSTEEREEEEDEVDIFNRFLVLFFLAWVVAVALAWR